MMNDLEISRSGLGKRAQDAITRIRDEWGLDARTLTVWEILRLRGVGRKTATEIVQYATLNPPKAGPVMSPEDMIATLRGIQSAVSMMIEDLERNKDRT